MLVPKEGLTFLKGQMDQMSAEQRRARALTLGQLSSVALMGDAERTSAAFDERIEAETNPREKEALRAQKQIALTRPQDLAKMYSSFLGAMGEEGKQVGDNLIKVWGLEAKKPTESFSTFDAAGVEKLLGFKNVAPGLYRINKETNKLESVGGGGGTQVTIKNEGSIPEGYRRIRDPQGNPLYDEPLPGSPAAAKFEAARKAETARAEGRTQASTIVTQEIDALTTALDAEEKATGTDKLNPYVRFTGIPGKAFEGVPGSARKSAQGFIDTIRANIGFEQLDKMRQESPTGGALGNITEQELKFLQSTLGTLDLDSDPAVLRRNLKRIRELYENVMRKAAAYPNADKYGFGAGGAAPAGGSQQPAEVPAPAAAPPTGGRNIGGGFRVLD